LPRPAFNFDPPLCNLPRRGYKFLPSLLLRDYSSGIYCSCPLEIKSVLLLLGIKKKKRARLRKLVSGNTSEFHS
jgi:hypothetical protein